MIFQKKIAFLTLIALFSLYYAGIMAGACSDGDCGTYGPLNPVAAEVPIRAGQTAGKRPHYLYREHAHYEYAP